MSYTVAAGTILVDKYRLISLLGRGGMGEVWRAEHLGLRAPVAIKLMNPDIISNPEALARFDREAQSAASLRSPHVVQILDHGLDPGIRAPFIAMELMEGESLAKRLERVGRLSAADTARIVTHIARALARAHDAGIVHRDLKPDNVFLVHNEDEEIAKVLDFGIAKANSQALGPGSATRTGAVMGTPYYMSPEQITGAKGVDHRTDLWALGVIACQCLTGQLPFNGETIGGLVIAICAQPLPRPSLLGPTPIAFDAWFERAMMRDPAQRFQSARELADELRRACSGALAGPVPEVRRLPPTAVAPAIAALSVGPLSHTAPELPMHGPGRLGLVIGAGLALLFGSGIGYWLLGSPRAGANIDAAGASASASARTAPAASLPLAAPESGHEPSSALSAQKLPSAAPAAKPPTVAPALPAAAPLPVQPAPRPASVVHPNVAPAPLPAPRPAPAVPGAPTPKPKPDIDPNSVFDRRKG